MKNNIHSIFFVVLALFAPALHAADFTNSDGITIRESGDADPYPSRVTVSGVEGAVVSVQVRITGLTHTFPDDVDVFLVSPSGAVAAVFSDAGVNGSVSNVNLLFDDTVPTVIPDASPFTTGTYRPANHPTSPDVLPPEATGGTVGTSLTALAAGVVNGEWKLYVRDDATADQGSITSWTLSIFTASDFTVTNANDSGAGSLRAALALAAAKPGADTITFDPGMNGKTIAPTGPVNGSAFTLANGEVVTVDASALSAGVKLDGGSQNFRFFRVNAGASLTLHGLTLTRGGGADLTALALVEGGAILNGGTLTLTRCTLSGNSASTDSGGGATQGGAISNSSTATLTHCTLSGNSTTHNGGAVYNTGTLALAHCTVSGNSVSIGGGGGISVNSGSITLTNTIVAGNSASNAARADIENFSTLIRVGANIVPFLSGAGTVTGIGTISTTAPNLASLGNYGGPTQTMPPLSTSPAIDAATVLAQPITSDQRGAPIVGAPDIGATEALSGPVNAVVTSNLDAGPGTLRDILAAVPTGSTITFDPAVFTGATATTNTILLNTSDNRSAFTLDKAVTIDATAIPGGVKLDGGSRDFRFFRVNNGASLTLHGLTLAGGGGADFTDFGGAIRNDGTLTLTRCTLSGNRADGIGGGEGAISNRGTATLTHCTLSGNSAFGSGGAILSSTTGTLTLTHCTLSGNVTTSGSGGGICNQSGLTKLTHCTLSGNTATRGAGNGSGVASFDRPNTETVVQNCIISGNTNSSVDFIDGTTNTFRSLGGNLIGTGNTTALAAFTAIGDILNDTPQLAPLADNGGPTQTMALLANSPARNAAAVLAQPITSDQRGLPIAGLPDIGAYEFPNSPPSAQNTAATATTGDQKTITVYASDADGIPPVIVGTPSSGAGLVVNSTDGLNITFTPSANFVGNVVLNYSVSDANGSLASGTVTVSVADNDAPEISGTFSPRMVFAGTMPDYRAQAVKSDNVGTPTVTQTPLQGTATTVGIVPVTLTATDSAGNTATTTFDVAVRPLAPVHTTHLAKGDRAPQAGSNGLPADAILASFGPPAIADGGSIGFVGKWTSNNGRVRGTGLFLNDRCYALVGGGASVTGTKYVSFSDPVVEGSQFACIAKLSNGGSEIISNFNTVNRRTIARTGEVAADAGDAKFKSFKAVALHGGSSGSIGFLAQLTGGTGTSKVTAANDWGVWVREPFDVLRLVYRDGFDLGNSEKVASFLSFQPGIGSPGQGRGWLSRSGSGVGIGVVLSLNTLTDKSKAIVLGRDGGTTYLARTGVVGTNFAPALAGASFATFRYPAMNDALANTFYATMKVGAGGVTKADAGGIFTSSADFSSSLAPYALLARIGKPAGVNDANFSTLSDPVISADGGIAFTATLKGGTAKGLLTKTLWWKPSGEPLELLAQGGTATVGDIAAAQWKSFTSLAITDRGPLFSATLVPGKGGVTAKTASGIWACDFTGTPRALFRTGDLINGKKLAKFTLLKVTVGSAGVTRSFNNTAQVVWLANFTDKSSAIIVTEVP